MCVRLEVEGNNFLKKKKKKKKKKQTKAVYLILVSSDVMPGPRTKQERNL